MTLIIGIRCSNGAVLGSDGAATFAALGQPTIQQPMGGKIHVLQGIALLGVSGPNGLGQRIEFEVTQFLSTHATGGMAAVEIGGLLRTVLWDKLLSKEFAVAAAVQPVLPGIAPQDALCSALLALPAGDKAELIQFDHTASPEVYTDELPFATIGVGQLLADPFLGFLKRIYWPDRAPTIEEGTFAALWTLRHVISLHPGGVANPVSLFNIARERGTWTARRLDQSDLAEHQQAVQGAEDLLKTYVKGARPEAPPPP